MIRFNSGYWALIIGGSSGFGLATAKKLACHGMNICIVHRDRRGSMKNIEPFFEEIRSTEVKLLTMNTDALSHEGRTTVLDKLGEIMGDTGKIRMILHAVAFGNLKLLAPCYGTELKTSLKKTIAKELSVPEKDLGKIIEKLFDKGETSLLNLVDSPGYNNQQFLDKTDFSRTIQAMGSNIFEWVQDIFQRHYFTDDARVLSLTSEGNSIAWRGYAAVSAAKAVLESLSRAMAMEFAPYGIRSNVIQAGVSDTAALRAIPGSRQIKAGAIERNPFKRLTKPEDVANFICLLCTDEASWVNGSLICVDGGERIG